MATITVGTIKTRARQKADLVGSNFISDSELLAYVNEAFAAWYDILVSRFEDYNLGDPTSFTITSGTPYLDLPADFYKLVGVDRSVDNGNQYHPIRPYAWRSRNRYQASYSSYGLYPRIGYRVIGNKLRFVPEDQSPGSYRLWYIPLPTVLTSDSDTVERYNGFEELIVIDTAMKMMAKEESDLSYINMERGRVEKRMIEMMQQRNLEDSGCIEEVERNDSDDEYFS